MNNLFPYAAITGQEDLKLVLLLNAINPKVSGVLIRGEKGTAKSTIVRSLSELLPEISVNSSCEFSCDPLSEAVCEKCKNVKDNICKRKIKVVTLPLNATEDMVKGGVDFKKAIQEGMKSLSPGILAKANRGILYIDEVNLLDDHITDVILDTSASKTNIVEREGISYSHPSDFVLIGTMNPEEGELRPQFLDRFGLCVEVHGEQDMEKRVSLMRLREAFDMDPLNFIKEYASESKKEIDKIATAVSRLKKVSINTLMRKFITDLCNENNVAGHRADLIIEQAATAHAALMGRVSVITDDIIKVASFALVHRKRDVEEPNQTENKNEDNSNNTENKDSDSQDENDNNSSEKNEDNGREDEKCEEENNQKEDDPSEDKSHDHKVDPNAKEDFDVGNDDDSTEKVDKVGKTFSVKPIESKKDRFFRNAQGKRSSSLIKSKKGRHIRSQRSIDMDDIAIDATIRAAAPFQKNRKENNNGKLIIKRCDIHRKIREKKIGNFILFLVDASGSMGAKGRMTASKGAVMSLLLDAYRKRDRVSMVSFRRKEAFLNLPPTSSIDLAAKHLSDMPVGGRTPFASGLIKAQEVIRTQLSKDPFLKPIIIVITDGKSNVSLTGRDPVDEAFSCGTGICEDSRINMIVIDTEEKGHVTFGLCEKFAAATGAMYYKTEDLKAEELISIVGDNSL
jgi:magnesium chelatase subunit D